MANPQLEDGYTSIANEILESLSWMNLGAYEWRVLLCVIRKTYGWKKKTDWISLSRFSRETGLDRRHAHRAIKSLFSKRMVVISTDDKKHPRYGFQKDYEKWKLPSPMSTLFQEQMAAKREKRRKKSAPTGDKIVPLQAPTKETIIKETIKKEEKRELSNPPILSKEKTTQNAKTKEEEQRLHCWLVKEQAAYVKEYPGEDIGKVDWKKYAEDYFSG